MWIIPPVICAMGIVVALLPPADPIDDAEPAFEAVESRLMWMPILLTMATLAVLGVALRAVFVA